VFPAGAIGLYLLLTGICGFCSSCACFRARSYFWQSPRHGIFWPHCAIPRRGTFGISLFYFVNEHILRFLNRRVPRDYDTVPLLLFWVLLVLWLIPWTVFLPQSLQEVPRRWREFRSQMTRRQRAIYYFSYGTW